MRDGERKTPQTRQKLYEPFLSIHFVRLGCAAFAAEAMAAQWSAYALGQTEVKPVIESYYLFDGLDCQPD